MEGHRENIPTGGNPMDRREALKLLGKSILVGGATLAGISCKPESSKTKPAHEPAEKMEPTATDEKIASTRDAAQNVLDNTGSKENNKDNPASIEISREDFEKLVDSIQKHGFIVKERGVPSDHQFTFFDSKGNRHAMITIKRDETGKPSTQGKVDQISVWAHREGIRDQEHSFGYAITNTGVQSFTPPTPEERKDIEFGYREFLAKVKK